MNSLAQQKDDTEKILFVSMIVVLSLFFVFFKYVTPALLETIYSTDSVNFLNLLTDTANKKTLEFYLGEWEENLLGPLAILISGTIFLVLAWRYLISSSSRVFGISVFGYFLLTRPEVLWYPPYGDTASGPFIEALWLVHHHFDYFGLSQQPLFVKGGPKIYLFSVYPTYLAMTMKLIPSVKIYYALHHLFTFIFASVAVVYVRKFFGKITDAKTALLGAILFLSLPLVQSQVEQINMEIPLLMLSVWSVYYLLEKRLWPAVLMAVLAIAVKGVGIVIAATVGFVSLLLFFIDDKLKFRWSTFLVGLTALIATALQLYLAFYVLNKDAHVDKVGLFHGWPEIKALPVFYLYLISLILFVGRSVVALMRKQSRTIGEYCHKYHTELVMIVTAGAWFGLFLHSYGMQYRYRLLLAPFILVILFAVVRRVIKSQRWLLSFLPVNRTLNLPSVSRMAVGDLELERKSSIKVFLTVLILLSFFASYGLIYPPQVVSVHSFLERSLEYRNDLKVHMRLAKELEKQFAHFTIGAPFTIAQILAFPELGYVKTPLDVMIYEFPCRYEGIKNFKGLKNLDIGRTIWVGFQSSIPQRFPSLGEYPVTEKDVVLKRIGYGRREAVLFMGGIAIERMHVVTVQMLKKEIELKILSDLGVEE